MTSKLNLINFNNSNVVYLVSVFFGVVDYIRGKKSQWLLPSFSFGEVTMKIKRSPYLSEEISKQYPIEKFKGLIINVIDIVETAHY